MVETLRHSAENIDIEDIKKETQQSLESLKSEPKIQHTQEARAYLDKNSVSVYQLLNKLEPNGFESIKQVKLSVYKPNATTEQLVILYGSGMDSELDMALYNADSKRVLKLSPDISIMHNGKATKLRTLVEQQIEGQK